MVPIEILYVYVPATISFIIAIVFMIVKDNEVLRKYYKALFALVTISLFVFCVIFPLSFMIFYFDDTSDPSNSNIPTISMVCIMITGLALLMRFLISCEIKPKTQEQKLLKEINMV